VLIEYQDYGIFNFDPRYLALTYIPFYAVLLWQVVRTKPAAATQPELF
jgi:hypothetical protein